MSYTIVSVINVQVSIENKERISSTFVRNTRCGSAVSLRIRTWPGDVRMQRLFKPWKVFPWHFQFFHKAALWMVNMCEWNAWHPKTLVEVSSFFCYGNVYEWDIRVFIRQMEESRSDRFACLREVQRRGIGEKTLGEILCWRVTSSKRRKQTHMCLSKSLRASENSTWCQSKKLARFTERGISTEIGWIENVTKWRNKAIQQCPVKRIGRYQLTYGILIIVAYLTPCRKESYYN